MAAVLDGARGDAEFNPTNAGESGEPIGDAGTVSGEPAANDNGAQWTSFGGDGASGGGYRDPDSTTANGSNSSDPGAPFGRFANGKPRKRRAKSGNGGAPKRDPAKESVPLASLLFSSHLMASKFLVPELELSEDESKSMARAISEVSQYYEIPMMSPQQVAWYNLASTAAMIYGTRFVAYRNRSRKEASEKRAGNVSQIRPMQMGAM